MNALTATLTVGTRLRHDGEMFLVVDFSSRRVTLRSAGGRERQLLHDVLLERAPRRFDLPKRLRWRIRGLFGAFELRFRRRRSQ